MEVMRASHEELRTIVEVRKKKRVGVSLVLLSLRSYSMTLSTCGPSAMIRSSASSIDQMKTLPTPLPAAGLGGPPCLTPGMVEH